MTLSSAARDLLTTLMIGSSLLWEIMLWLSVSVIKKKQSCIRYSKRRKFRPKMRLAAGLCPDPLGKVERSPRPFSRNWGRVLTSKGEGKEGNGKREGRGWQGGREEGEGRKGKGGPPSRIAEVQRWQP